MFRNRGKRGRPKKYDGVVALKVTNEAQLERTLGLLGINGEKPHINDIMPIVEARLERERVAAMMAMARSWQRGNIYGMLYPEFDEDYPGWDDEDEEAIAAAYLGCSSNRMKKLNKKLYKHGRKNSKNRGSEDDDFWENRRSMYTNGEWSEDDEEVYEQPDKVIKFYDDIEDESNYREFSSLKEFSDFCDENGYHISTVDYSNLVDWQVVHCCLDPISLEYDQYDVITDNSYGGLYWTVSDDITKHNEYHGSGIDKNTYRD